MTATLPGPPTSGSARRSRRVALAAMFSPRSVAVVGASGREGNPFARPLQNLLRFGFPGLVYPVNPRYDRIGDVPCYPALEDVPGPVDLALLLVPAAGVLEAVEACVRHGVRAGVLFSSGFAETGAVGLALQERVVATARAGGMVLLGPNCQGFLHAPSRLAATFTGAVGDALPERSSVAYIGQSGAVGGSFLDIAREHGMGVGTWVSTGNQPDLDVLEIGEHVLGEDTVKVLALYLESLGDGERYARLLRRAREAGKHVVVLRSGRSGAGACAVASHTGALVPPDLAVALVSQDGGAHAVDDVDEFVSTAQVLSALPPAAGPRVGIITTSGGAGGVAADQCESRGLVVPALSVDVRQQLSRLVPDFGSVTNPVDVTAHLFSVGERAFPDVCRIVADSGEVDAVIVVLTMVTGEPGRRLAEDVVALSRDSSIPILLVWLAGYEQTCDGRRVLRRAGLPVMGSLREASEGVTHLREAGRAVPTVCTPQPADAVALAAALDVTGTPAGMVLTEAAGAAFLDAAGVARPEGEVVGSAGAAEAAAARLAGSRGRVVLKVQAVAVTHKSDVGGVRVGVAPADAGSAYDALLADVAAAIGDVAVDGVLVQRMVDGVAELLVGVTASPAGFPPVLTVGSGGTAAELWADTASAVLPLDGPAVRRLLGQLRGAPLLLGYRGRPEADLEAAVEAVVRIAVAAWAVRDRLAELEVNPLLVARRGEGAVAVDLLLRLADEVPEVDDPV